MKQTFGSSELEIMARSRSFAPFFQRLIDDPQAALEALRVDPAGFERSIIDEEGGRLVANCAIPTHGALGAILFDEAGLRVSYSDDQAWLPTIQSFDDIPAARERQGRLITVPGARDFPVHALWAPVADTAGWNLPPALRLKCEQHSGGRLLLMVGGVADEGPLDAASRAFGLTDLERRVMKAVARTGSVRSAAAILEIGYGTARDTVQAATRRIGARNLPSAVRTLVAAAFGVQPDEGDSATILSDMLPINERQARIAASIANGMTRHEVAAALRVSAAVVKKDLEIVFSTLGVSSAAELSRLVCEVRALRLFTRSTDGALGLYDPVSEPTRLTPRAAGNGIIAWSDYGPRSGQPVLVVHSNWCCRSVPRPLVASLHRRGFRPIAIDRPGFGLTDVGRSTLAEPFGQAITDVTQILDQLGIAKLPIVARCGAQFVMAFKKAAPERIGRVVLVSPSPQTGADGLRKGIVGVVKEAFYRSPRLIEFFFRIISAQISFARVETLTRAIVHGQPADTKLCDDPTFLRDRLRAIRPLSTGRMTGAILEEHVVSHGGISFPVINELDWVVLQGDHDSHNSYSEVHSYWSHFLPSARFVRVPDGGRFMTSSHHELITEALGS